MMRYLSPNLFCLDLVESKISNEKYTTISLNYFHLVKMSSKKEEKIEVKLVKEMNKLGENLGQKSIEDSLKLVSLDGPHLGELEKVPLLISSFNPCYLVNPRVSLCRS